MTDLTYPFDPTGTNPANRISNEVHVITPVNERHFNFAVMHLGPFFADNVSIVFRHPDNTIWNMQEGVDYYLSHKFLSASKACAKELYGSITFINTQTVGKLYISYNTIGGTWTATPAIVASIMANLAVNPRTTTWEEVNDLPYQFPVIDHEWDLVDMVGMSDVVAKLDEIYDVLFQSGDTSITAHIQNVSNPHSTTKAQVGLPLVQNYGIATVQQMQEGTSNEVYMTALLVKNAVNFHGANLIASHTGRTDNPHNTTKDQVGLALVENYPPATSVEAGQGTATNRYLTPATGKALFDAFNTTNVAHLARVDNPHNTTKDQVGLNLVQNYSMATLQLAQAGTNTTSYMSPSTTAGAISFQALVPLNTHINDTSNPHGVTKAQVGLASVQDFPLATQQQAIDMTSNSAYMTPLRVKQAVESMGIGGGALEAHLDNFFNPHNVTAEQVDAYTYTEVDNLLSGVNTTITNHTSRTDNPHNTTAAQVGAYTTAQTDNAIASAVAPAATHAARTDNPHNTTAAQVGAYTTTQTDGAITTAVNGIATTLRAELKKLTNNPKTAAYTLIIDDVNKLINTNSGVQVPPAVFSAGDGVVIYNNSASAVTITQQSGVTMRQAGTTTTGDRVLAAYGTASLLCVAANTFVINGAGLT